MWTLRSKHWNTAVTECTLQQASYTYVCVCGWGWGLINTQQNTRIIVYLPCHNHMIITCNWPDNLPKPSHDCATRALREHRPPWQRPLITFMLTKFTIWRVRIVIPITPQSQSIVLGIIAEQSIKFHQYLPIICWVISDFRLVSQYGDPEQHPKLTTSFCYHYRPILTIPLQYCHDVY